MPHNIVIKTGMFLSDEGREYSQKCLLYCMEALVNCNREFIRRGQGRVPSLYESGCLYVRENETEDWLGIPEILRAKGGDCEDLACWRVAELREAGIPAKPFLRWRKYEPNFWLYHVMVMYPDGRMEDPSKRLGMKGSE